MAKIEFNAAVHIESHSPHCPICSSPANVFKRKIEPTDNFEGWCEVCGGNVRITTAAIEEVRSQRRGHFLSAWLRRRPVEEREDAGKPTLLLENVERILKDAPAYSVLDRLDLTLTQIAAMTPQPGSVSNFEWYKDWPLVYAVNRDEAMFYQHQLADLGYIEARGSAKLITKGYQRLAEIQRAGRQSESAFVAMWFDATMNDVYDDAIQPAVSQAGYIPVRIDRQQHANRIDDEIIGRIKQSRFMVADFTEHRPGVYFEAGMMLGLGRTVIWMCKKSDLARVHFDTRQYNFIDYETVAEAKKRLYDRIIAIEGEGPTPRSER